MVLGESDSAPQKITVVQSQLVARKFRVGITNIDPNDVMILSHDANLRRMEFSETTGISKDKVIKMGREVTGKLLMG